MGWRSLRNGTKATIVSVILPTLLLAIGCADRRTPVTYAMPSVEASRVLVVVNSRSELSLEIGNYYLAKRGIPASNLCTISVSPTEEVVVASYKQDIENPIRQKLVGLNRPIDYIVFTKGVPFRMNNKGLSIDAAIASMDIKDDESAAKDPNAGALPNPYYGKSEPFSHEKYGMYLVTRLDGYTIDDVKKLIEQSIKAYKVDGTFLIDEADDRKTGDYGKFQETFVEGVVKLRNKKLQVIHDQEREFASPTETLIGYASWGSNDRQYRPELYRKLKFAPGAIAETFVSTSARTFKPTSGGQSLIADLIHQGVTGVKGYCSEPYLFAMANPSILFDRYTDGYNLAESFYMASPVIKWKDIIIGDPICRPFKK